MSKKNLIINISLLHSHMLVLLVLNCYSATIILNACFFTDSIFRTPLTVVSTVSVSILKLNIFVTLENTLTKLHLPLSSMLMFL